MDEGAKTKSYKQYLEIEIARRRNGRVDRPGARFSKVPVTFRTRNQSLKSKYKE